MDDSETRTREAEIEWAKDTWEPLPPMRRAGGDKAPGEPESKTHRTGSSTANPVHVTALQSRKTPRCSGTGNTHPKAGGPGSPRTSPSALGDHEGVSPESGGRRQEAPAGPRAGPVKRSVAGRPPARRTREQAGGERRNTSTPSFTHLKLPTQRGSWKQRDSGCGGQGGTGCRAPTASSALAHGHNPESRARSAMKA